MLQIGRGAHEPGAVDPAVWKRADWNRIDAASIGVYGLHSGLGEIRTACSHIMHGDSGGPLVLFQGGQPMVVGVAAAGPAVPCASESPDHYAMLLAGPVYRWVRGLLSAEYPGATWLDDPDRDDVPNVEDICPALPNPRREPPEGDGTQLDSDGDGWGDECDNCPGVDNADQTASDYSTGPTVECPNLSASASRRAWDGTGDACDACPFVVDTYENTNRRHEAEFGVVERGDACDPDPVIPRVVLEPRFRRGGAGDPPVPSWCALNDGYAIRFATYGFGGRWSATPPPEVDGDHRVEPVRLLWCSCWDRETATWLPELRPGEVPDPDVRYCNEGLVAPCVEKALPSTGVDATNRRGWFDFTNFEWNPMREVDEASTSEVWRRCLRDGDITPRDWDSDATWNPSECLPLKFGSTPVGDGVQFRRNGVIPLRNPRMHEVRWRPDAEDFATNAPPIDDQPHHVRLWLRPEPGRTPGALTDDGGWSSEASTALTAAGVDGNRFDNTYRSQRAVVAPGSLSCAPFGLAGMVARRVTVPVRAYPPGSIGDGAGLKDGKDGSGVTDPAPAVAVVPIDEAALPLPSDAAWLRYSEEPSAAAIAGIAVLVLDAESPAIAAVLPSRVAPGDGAPNTRGLAFAQILANASKVIPAPTGSEGGLAAEGAGSVPGGVGDLSVRLLAFGGRDASGQYSSTMWLGSEVATTERAVVWRPVPPRSPAAPPGREDAALFVTADGRRAVVAAGRNEQGPLSDVWVFDFQTATWSPLDPSGLLLEPGLVAGAAQSGDVGFLLTQAQEPADGGSVVRLWSIDLRSGSVGSVVSPGSPSGWPRSGSALAARPDGRLLVYGGTGAGSPHNDLWVLDPRLGFWSELSGDCFEGICPGAGTGAALALSPSSGEAVIFASALRPSDADDLLFVWRGDRWAGLRELTGLIPAGDCDGDTLAEPEIGELCPGGENWWAAPGAKGCDSSSGTPACLGGAAAGVLAATYRVPSARALAVIGRRALVARGSQIDVIDLPTPAVPERVATVNVRGVARDIAVVRNVGLVAAGSRVAVVDLPSSGDPVLTDRMRACGVPWSIAATDLGIGAALCNQSLAVLAVAGPGAVERIAVVRLDRTSDGGWVASAVASEEAETGADWSEYGDARFVEMEATSAFVVLGVALLHIDLSQPAAPIVRGAVTLPFSPSAFRVAGGFGYLVGSSGQTTVVDLRADQPVVTGRTHELTEWARGVELADGVACRLRRSGILEIADVAETSDRGGDSSGVGLPLSEGCCETCGF